MTLDQAISAKQYKCEIVIAGKVRISRFTRIDDDGCGHDCMRIDAIESETAKEDGDIVNNCISYMFDVDDLTGKNARGIAKFLSEIFIGIYEWED